MDKQIAHVVVTETFNFLEVKAAGRTVMLMALAIVEQMAHAAIDAGLLDYLKQKGALRQLPADTGSVFPPKTEV